MRRVHPRHTRTALAVRPFHRDPLTWEATFGAELPVRAQTQRVSEVVSDDAGVRATATLRARIPIHDDAGAAVAALLRPRSLVSLDGEVLSLITATEHRCEGRPLAVDVVAGELPDPTLVRVAVSDPTATAGADDGWNPDEGIYDEPDPSWVVGGPADEVEVWRAGVPAYVETFGQASDTVQVGQNSTQRRYLLRLPVTVPTLQVGQRVHVLAAPTDPDMVDLTVTIVDVRYASPHSERIILCEHNQQSTQEG